MDLYSAMLGISPDCKVWDLCATSFIQAFGFLAEKQNVATTGGNSRQARKNGVFESDDRENRLDVFTTPTAQYS